MDLDVIRERLLERENNLSEYATKSSSSIRLRREDEDIRPAFFHDTDRVIHSMSYTRYIDKTQVYSFSENDHISKRIIHVSLVSKIARTIGRVLNLNEDLIEAIALGHDIGHTPIGHVGEHILNDIAKRELNETFLHNIQSVREYMFLENDGRGINLSIQVLDGMMCHNGEFVEGMYYPKVKTKEEFLKDYEMSLKDSNYAASLRPMTLEGCVVRISDVIAYLGRDIEDAVRLGKLDNTLIPNDITSILGSTNSEIVNNIVLDIIKNSLDKPYIKLSDEVYNAIKSLKAFNYKYIYNKANTKENIEFYTKAFNTLFKTYLDDITYNRESSSINKLFLIDMDREYINKTDKKRIVIDFIAGMTDEFFLHEYEKCK